ncbi:MAG TPA: helix-turn-helix transcriptional regulator [Lutibacter sp.]|nr:helix-turn-helix transcriptional regulator [Lutibacter sp.]
MVNIEQFAKRLNILMDYYEISAALLAEKIEVQRSSISHILSGRNKPSLEFVLKILKAFPEVELYWLLNGVGSFPKQVEVKGPAPTLFSEIETPEVKINEPKVAAKHTNYEIEQERKDITGQEIERIVIFYKNGSFKNYTP